MITMNTHDNTTVPQWAKDAGSEIYRKGLRDAEAIASIIAEYARLPATPAQTPQASIWRPVSVKAEPKVNGRGICRFKDGAMNTFSTYYFEPTLESDITHWCYLSDFLALAPLPVAKTQEELDAEWVGQLFRDCDPVAKIDVLDAIAYGRATATAAKETK